MSIANSKFANNVILLTLNQQILDWKLMCQPIHSWRNMTSRLQYSSIKRFSKMRMNSYYRNISIFFIVYPWERLDECLTYTIYIIINACFILFSFHVDRKRKSWSQRTGHPIIWEVGRSWRWSRKSGTKIVTSTFLCHFNSVFFS